MKKKIYLIVLPLLIIVAVLMSCLPMLINADNDDFSGSVVQTSNKALGDQIFYALNEDTGAATASSSYKGGILFLAPGTSYTMNGGTWSGHNNVYGGAVYVSSNATFTLSSGTITSNSATYGGAIYVEDGGTCRIFGGSIINNSAKTAPAIYVEDGGKLEVQGDAVIEDNFYPYRAEISLTKTKVGGVVDKDNNAETDNSYVSTLELYTVNIGSYPQTYVGDEMNAILDSAKMGLKLGVDGVELEYTNIIYKYGFFCYKYTDGNLYAKGTCQLNTNNQLNVFKNGDTIVDAEAVWFKVEPIKWFVLNYDSYRNGDDDYLSLLSENALFGEAFCNASGTNNWQDSHIRDFLNNSFYNEAFSPEEKSIIMHSVIKNSFEEFPDLADTEDYVFLPSLEEMSSGVFAGINEWIGNGIPAKLCAPTDFALATNVRLANSLYVYSYYRGPEKGTSSFWITRTAGERSGSTGFVYTFSYYGGSLSYSTFDPGCAIRPAIRVAV